MSKMMVVAMFVVCVLAGWGHAQEMPPEVKAFLDNYTKDSTAHFGPLDLKRDGTIPDWVQNKDLRIRVIQEYVFKNDINWDAYPNTVALSEVIRPSNRWFVAVMAHDKAFCELTLGLYRKGKPSFGEATGPTPNGLSKHSVWGPLLKAYPESTGINPVLVSLVPQEDRSFLYFKQFSPRKIYYCDKGFYRPDLDSLFPSSIETLDDSKHLIKYKKELDIKEKAERARLGKVKDAGKVEKKVIGLEDIFSHPALRPAIYSIPALKREEAEAEHKKMFPAEDGSGGTGY
jgi:hypothetical protein